MKKIIIEYEYKDLNCKIIEVAIISRIIDKYYEIQVEDWTNPWIKLYNHLYNRNTSILRYYNRFIRLKKYYENKKK